MFHSIFHSIFYILNYAIFTINVIIPYYIFPLGYMYYFLTTIEENNSFLNNFVFIIMFIYSIMNIFYPLLCHNLPYHNYRFN